MLNLNCRKAFVSSIFTEENPFNSTEELESWLNEKKAKAKFNIKEIPFVQSENWYFDKSDSYLKHRKNAFFAVKGIEILDPLNSIKEWNQIILHQEEIGILGIIVKEIKGVLYFLMQAKFEPGNIHEYQLAPTFQATKSNYSQAHEGRLPKFSEYFLNAEKNAEIIFHQLQSEHNSRFFQKQNVNTLIEIFDEPIFGSEFKWFTFAQISHFLKQDNLVNMNSRSVLAMMPIHEILEDFKVCRKLSCFGEKLKKSINHSEVDGGSVNLARTFLNNFYSRSSVNLSFKNINELEGWNKNDFLIENRFNPIFKIIMLEAEIEGREVVKWDQPIIESLKKGLLMLIVKEIDGVLKFLFQAKFEIGTKNFYELAPTIQTSDLTSKPEFFEELTNDKNKIISDTWQSEEGGRFFKEENRNVIIEVSTSFSEKVPENFIWLSYGQILDLVKESNIFNLQSRSLISLLTFNL